MVDHAEVVRAADADIRRIDSQIAYEQDALARAHPWLPDGTRRAVGIRQLRIDVLVGLREKAVVRRAGSGALHFAETLTFVADPNRPGRRAAPQESLDA